MKLAEVSRPTPGAFNPRTSLFKYSLLDKMNLNKVVTS